MTLPVSVSLRARREILRIDEWWSQNRPAAPNLFAEELEAAFERIGERPGSGRPYSLPGHEKSMRVLLRSTRYHVYYEFDGGAVYVITVWSALRGRDPRPR